MESGIAAGSRVFIAGNATVIGDVTLGDDASVWFGAVVRADRDSIAIGAESNVQDNAVVHTTPGFPVTIGSQVSVGHGAILHGCTIRDRVLVGMGAIVLNGAVVGEGSIIGAGAVVTEGKEIPPGSLVLGVPGRVVKETDEKQREGIVKNATVYSKLAGRYRT
jgi:carbonic anhydrase/acetyltransferase-like protein (isoleucine patch superfamily)